MTISADVRKNTGKWTLRLIFLAAAAANASAVDAGPRITPLAREAGGVYFEPNVAQAGSSVTWIARASAYTALLDSTGVTFACSQQAPEGATIEAVRMEFAGGAKDLARLRGRDRLSGISNYFLGSDPEQWRTGVPHYASIESEDGDTGEGIRFYGTEGQLEYDIILASGADIRHADLFFRGGKPPRLNASGELVVESGCGDFRQRPPNAYQLRDGVRQQVRVSYDIRKSGRVRFRVDAYDPSLPLVIDPVVNYSTYLGLSGSGQAVAVDSSGNAYATGYSYSVGFPFSNAIQSTLKGDCDVFVAKFNASGQSLVYATYLGGSNYERGAGIAVDTAGNAYVTGFTASSDFPTANARQPSSGGSGDAFVAKLSPNGTSLLFSTFLGGSSGDSAAAIGLDGLRNVYVAGYTYSANFPTAFPAQAALRGQTDAFLVRFDQTGAVLQYSTYFGGTQDEAANALAVDSTGNVWIGGETNSTDLSLLNPVQSNHSGGGRDGFLARFSPAGSLLMSTYLGGTDTDYVSGLALDAAGNLVSVGRTATHSGFPLVNALLSDSDIRSCFLNKLSPSNTILFSTLISGSAPECGSVAVDPSGDIVVVGSAFDDHPVVAPILTGLPKWGVPGAFVSKVAADGSAFRFSTFLGAAQIQQGAYGVAVDPAGAIYVTGYAYGPIVLVNPINSAVSGTSQPFVTKLTDDHACSFDVWPTQLRIPTSTSPVEIVVSTGSACWWNVSPLSVLGGVVTVASLEGVYTPGLYPKSLSRGNGLVTFSAWGSSSGLPRSQTFVVAGRGVTITQDGWGCSYDLGARSSADVPAAGGTFALGINAVSDCPATAVSNVSWIAIPSPTVVSGGIINCVVAPNPGVARIGTIGIAGLVFTVNQAAADLSLGTVTVTTIPAGLQIVVDGNTLTAPQTFRWVPGASHVIGTVSPQVSESTRYVWSGWSDGGAMSHSILTPAAAGGATYTASFTTQYRLIPILIPNGGGTLTVSPASADGFYNSGSQLTLTAQANPGYLFAGFDGDVRSSANPQPLTMNGPKTFYVEFRSISANRAPAVVSVSPATGNVSSQTFVFTFSDPDSWWQELSVVNVLINFWLDGRQSCYLAYSRPANTLYLVNDAGDGYAGSMPLNGSGTLGNGQCTVNGAQSGVADGLNTLALTLNMTFPASFAGTRIIYAAARDFLEANSGWQRMGVWKVPGGSQTTTTAVAGMNPARGSGLVERFTFTFTDTKGANDLGVMNVLVNDWLDGRHACYLAYARGYNTLYLMNDNGDGLLPGMALNGSGSLGNSQCWVYGVGSSASSSGNTLTLTLQMSFGAGFKGNRVFYLAARDVNELNNTGWQAMGAWTVP